MNFIQKASELNIWYIPIIVFVVLLLFGFLTGFFRGWKVSLYFTLWNIIGYLVVLFVLDALYDSQFKNIADKLLSSVSSNLGEKAFADVLHLLKGWVILTVVLTFLGVWNLLGFIISLFFARKWTKELKENKAAGKSNAKSRWIGGTLGIIAVLPSTAAAMGASTIACHDAGVNKFVDQYTKAITFGKVPHLSDDYDAIYGLVLSAQSAQDMSKLFAGDDSLSTDQIIKDKDAIVKLFNNDKSATIASDIITHQLNGQTLDQSTIDAVTADASGKFASLKNVFANLSASGIENLRKTIQANAGTNTLNLDGFITFLTGK